MAKKISELPVNFPYEGSEKLLMVQDGRTKAGFLSAFTAYLSDELLTDSELAALSSVWQSTYTTVSANSAIWQSSGEVYNDSALQAASGSWDSTYTTVSVNSASWGIDTVYDDSTLQAASGDWDSTYTTVSVNSASWSVDTIYDDSTLQAASGDWDSTYTTVSANSATWAAPFWYITKMGNEADDASGTGEKTAWIAPAAGKIYAVHSGCSIATAGAALTVDVQKNAVTILSTKGVIASGDDSTTTGTAHILSTTPTSFAAGDRISFHIDTFGGTGANGLHTDLLVSWD